MSWTVIFISLFVMVVIFEWDLFFSIIILVIVSALMTSVEVVDTVADVKIEIVEELERVKLELAKQKKDTDVHLPPPKPKKVISIKNYDDVKRVYLSNSNRSYEEVHMKTLAGKTYACKTDDTCITEPTMKRHINNVLYACEGSNICYPVQ